EMDTTSEPDATGCVGGDAELAVLSRALDRARAGHGSVIAIVGEPGVGKSRLVAEFRNALPAQVDRMTARCASYEQATPYALVAAFIRCAFGIHAADDEAGAAAALQAGLKRYAAVVDASVSAVVIALYGHPALSTQLSAAY